jgi:GNAT superfamily N-acetyltransferase
MMAGVDHDAGRPPPGGLTVGRLEDHDWRVWRDVRLAALADAPAAFGTTLDQARAIQEEGWRAMIRDTAIFVAAAEGTPVGVAAGLHRAPAPERGLGAMWVAPPWRGRGVAAVLAAAVIAWATSEGAETIGLWVPDDNPRARRFYEHQGFRATGRRKPFPGDGTRLISGMSLPLDGRAGRAGGQHGDR